MQIVALLLLVASGIVNYLDRSALSIANIEVRQELGLSATAMGVLLSAFLMSYAFSQLPAGILVDRIGPRILLGVGLVIWSVAQGAAGLVTSYAQFFAARIGLGVGESPQFPTGARVVSNWFHVVARDRLDCSEASHASRRPPYDYLLNVQQRRNVTATVSDLVVGDPCLGDC